MVKLRGNCDPGLAFSVEVDVCILAVMVLDVMLNDFLPVDGEDGGLLLARDTLFLVTFFPVDKDDFRSM